MPVSFSSKVLISSDALFQEIGGEGVILDLASSSYFGLDEVGMRLWQLLQADSSLKNACDRLLEEYDVEPEQLEMDLLKLVDQLVETGLATIE
jgi:uncharacterized protein HemX